MRTHSDETKRKISEGLKRHYEQKRIDASPNRVRRRRLADRFTEGHPDSMEPSRVRNFGDLGDDVRFIHPQTSAETAQQKLDELRRSKSAMQQGSEQPQPSTGEEQVNRV